MKLLDTFYELKNDLILEGKEKTLDISQPKASDIVRLNHWEKKQHGRRLSAR